MDKGKSNPNGCFAKVMTLAQHLLAPGYRLLAPIRNLL
jgi:hypothetical protein